MLELQHCCASLKTTRGTHVRRWKLGAAVYGIPKNCPILATFRGFPLKSSSFWCLVSCIRGRNGKQTSAMLKRGRVCDGGEAAALCLT